MRFFTEAVLVICGIVVVSVAAYSTSLFLKKNKVAHEKTIVARILEIEKCPNAACLKVGVMNLLDREEPEALMAQIAASAAPTECHYMFHAIGREMYKRDNSVEQSLSKCSPQCGFACSHGVIGEAFASQIGPAEEFDPAHLDIDDIKRIGSKLCTDMNLCHGIGHVLFQSLGDLSQALQTCDQISSDAKKGECYKGVFMEYSDWLLDKSVWKVAPQRYPDYESVARVCFAVSREAQEACFWYFPDMLRSALRASGEGNSRDKTLLKVREICESIKETAARGACFTGFGIQKYDEILRAPEAAVTYCAALETGKDRESCIYGMVSMAAEYKKNENILKYCSAQIEPELKTRCLHFYYTRSFE